MKILFVHNNFPAQFARLAEALSRFRDVDLAAIGCETAREMPGVRLHRYRSPAAVARAHSFARRFDNESRRAEEVLYAGNALRKDGFTPDLVFVHPGWGEGLPLRTLFPGAKIIVYCEYYYRRHGGDIGFDPEFPTMGVDGFVALDARNAATLLSLASCDAAVSPTEWQKSTYPAIVRSAITVAHDGVDTDFSVPIPSRRSCCRTASACRPARRSSPTRRAISSPCAAFTVSCARCPRRSKSGRRRAC